MQTASKHVPDTTSLRRRMWSGEQPIGRIFAVLLIMLLGGIVAFHSLGNYNHNDHMYAVAPVIALDHRPYTDFAYVQTPLSLIAFVQIYKIVGAQALFPALRIFSLLLNFATLAVGIYLARCTAYAKIFVTLFFSGVYLCFGPTEVIGAEIGNYTLALFLFALSLLCFDRLNTRGWAPLLVGLLTGLAVSAKISYVYIIPAYGLLYFLAWRATSFRQVTIKIATLCGGVAIGLTPIFFYLLSDPTSFLFENVYIHYLTNIYRGISPFTAPSNLSFFAIKSATIPLGLFLIAITLGVLATRKFATPKGRFSGWALPMREKNILWLAAAALIGAVTPSIIFPQYLAAPGFLIILFVCIFLDRNLADLKDAQHRQRAYFATACMVLLFCTWRCIDYLSIGTKRVNDGTYGIVAVEQFRKRLSKEISNIDKRSPGCHGDLVSAFAVPAVGAGANLSLVDSAGPFLMRLDDVFATRAPAFRRFSDVRRYLSYHSLVLSGFYNDGSYEPHSGFEFVIERYVAVHAFGAVNMGTFMYKPITLYLPAACRV